ncbi:MAG: ShlB/FhaC/HecB family hemolysin secretion/activation protein [Verrucomicrobiales bacterium]
MNDRFLALLSCLVLIAIQARGNDILEQLSPERPSNQEPRRQSSPSGQSGSEGSVEENAPLLESLKGIVIATEKELASAVGVTAKVVVAGLRQSAAGPMARLGEPRIGRPATLHDLKTLQAAMEEWLHAHGSPLSDVYLPPQEISSGIVTYAVRERLVGQVTMKGTPAFGKEYILREFRPRPGQELNSRKVLEDLQWLNQNPFRRVDLLYTDGEKPELSKLQLQVNEQTPWRVYSGYNNYSNERTGDHRIFAGFQLGNLWNAEHQLYFQALSSLDTSELGALSASYVAPLPWRHLLEVSGVTSRSSINLPSELELSGDTWRVAAKYRVPLPPAAQLRHEWNFGAEFQENSYDVQADDGRSRGGGTTIFNLRTGYELHHGDRLGATALEIDFTYSPGIFGADDADYDIVRKGARAEYWLVGFEAERHWWLPLDSSLYMKAAGQYADQPLLATERYSPTGGYEVRGYDENVLLADSALRLTMEWRSQGFRTPLGKLFETGRDRLQFIGFWDYAILDNDTITAPGPLQSVGFGLRYQAGRNLTVKADLGFPLEEVATTRDEESARLHLSMMASF